MTTYSVSRTIDAAPQVVWDLLTDASAYPDWNPAVIAIEGSIREGETIRLTSIVNPDRQFKLRVSDVTAPTHMVWWDGMPFGLFKGVRTFDVVAQGERACVFEMEEVYSGLMAPLITKSIPDMTESFQKFGDGLKEAAESR